MGGILGGNTISSSATRIEALQLQSSTFGAAQSWAHGTTRIAGNVIWYGGFEAIPHTDEQSAGGKGGGVKVKSTTFTYRAAVIMGLCSGTVAGIPTVWRGKQRTTLGELGLTLFGGALGQAAWSWLTGAYPAQALAYNGLAYVAASAYDLGDAARIDNHNFEVQGNGYGAYGTPDAQPATIGTDWLTDPIQGAGVPAGFMGSTTTWATYCRAQGLLLSPALTEQAPAADRIRDLCAATNTAIVPCAGQLNFVPMGDEVVTGNGATYTPDLTPLYNLTPSHFTPSGRDDPPVHIRRVDPADAYNQVTVEFLNRAQDYNVETVDAKDQASIELYGLRPAPTIMLHWACTAAVAAAVAQIALKRYLGIRNTYTFSLPPQFALLLPTNINTLSEPSLGLAGAGVRIVSISEDEDHWLTIEAEDLPAAIGSVSAYPVESGAGYLADYNVAPGDAQAPLFIEPPVELTTSGLEVWVATAGSNPNWGGCQVWVSWTGSDYKLVDTIHGGARYGTLTAAFGSADTTAALQLNDTTRQLLSGTSTDAATLATLCRVKAPGQPPEFLAYTTATLTGAGAYTLSGLVRGAYDSGPRSHTIGATFARLDSGIAKSGQLDPDVIGKTLHVKLVSFNIFGGALQDISSVTAHTYQITGEMALLPPANVSSFTITIQADGTRQFDWHWGTQAKPADLQGYVVRFRQGTGPYTWDDLEPFNTDDGFHTSSPIESNLLLAGDYVFAIKAIDKWGVLSTTPLIINATLPDPRLGNAVEFFDYFNLGWPAGTLTDCVRDTWDGELILRARDQATWSTIPGTWSAWTRWVWDPVTTFTYETPAVDFGATISVLPVAQIVADGDSTFQAATSADGSTWSSWASVAGPLLTRYAKTRITVTIPSGSSTGAGVTPICVLRRFAVTWVGKVSSETVNDVDPTTFSGTHRLAAGHYRLPLQHTWVHISRLTVTIQNVTSNWGWTPVDKYHADGPEIKIYNGAGTLADPPLIDYTIEGISS